MIILKYILIYRERMRNGFMHLRIEVSCRIL